MNATPQTLRSARPDLTASLPTQTAPERNVPEGTEVRGFALYVGLADDKIADGDPRLGTIVTRIKQLVAELGNVRGGDSSHAMRTLGWTMRTPEEAILATAHSLTERGIVKV